MEAPLGRLFAVAGSLSACCGAPTVSWSMTFFTPSVREAICSAASRAASSLTEPESVTVPKTVEVLMGWFANFPSEANAFRTLAST